MRRAHVREALSQHIVQSEADSSLYIATVAFKSTHVIEITSSCLHLVLEAVPKKFPLLRLAVTITQHCEDNVTQAVPPAPGVSRFISGAELTSVGSNTPLAASIEELFREKVRGEFEPWMIAKVDKRTARGYCRMLEVQIVRLAFSKSLHPKYPGGVAGKYSTDKAEKLIRNWILFVQNHCHDLQGMAEAFKVVEEAAAKDTETSNTDVTFQNLSVHERLTIFHDLANTLS